MKQFIINEIKSQHIIKSPGISPGEIFLSSCILPPNCYKNGICEEFLPGGKRRDFSLFVVGVAWGVGGKKSAVDDLTGRLTDGLPGNPTTKPSPICNLSSPLTYHTSYLLITTTLIPHIPLTHDTLYSSLQTLSKTTDPHNKKARSANFLRCNNI